MNPATTIIAQDAQELTSHHCQLSWREEDDGVSSVIHQQHLDIDLTHIDGEPREYEPYMKAQSMIMKDDPLYLLTNTLLKFSSSNSSHTSSKDWQRCRDSSFFLTWLIFMMLSALQLTRRTAIGVSLSSINVLHWKRIQVLMSSSELSLSCPSMLRHRVVTR